MLGQAIGCFALANANWNRDNFFRKAARSLGFSRFHLRVIGKLVLSFQADPGGFREIFGYDSHSIGAVRCTFILGIDEAPAKTGRPSGHACEGGWRFWR